MTETELRNLIEEAKKQVNNDRVAERYWRSAALSSKDLLGQTHDTTAFCVSNLAQNLLQSEKPTQAIAMVKPLLCLLIKERGLYTSGLEFLCWSLGNAYRAIGDHEASYSHWKMAADSAECTKGALHRTTIHCLQQAARALANQRLFEDALPLFLRVHERLRQSLGNKALNVAYAARDLGTCYDMLSRYEDALDCWQEAVRIFRAHPSHEYAKSLRCLQWTERHTQNKFLSTNQREEDHFGN